MCGIVGYVGDGHAKEKIINGLKSLEYRGYDSAGIALDIDGKIEVRKQVGGISNLEKIIDDDSFDSGTEHHLLSMPIPISIWMEA